MEEMTNYEDIEGEGLNELNLSNRCALSNENESLLCSHAENISFCSLEDRSYLPFDRSKHNNDCIPATIQKDDVRGRFLVATRAIKQGELIFKEKPLITGPDPTIPIEQMPLCLGCYKQVKSGYKCSVCKWPMCNSSCEKLVHHSDFECKILASRNVPSAKYAIHYIFVNVLRCYMLQKSNPSKWRRILSLEHHEKLRLKQSKRRRLLGFLFTLFQIIFKASSFGGSLISQIFGAIEINAFGFSDEEEQTGFNRSAQFLFYDLSILSHDCVPNATWVRVNEEESKGNFSAKLVAILPIHEGDQIIINYTNPMKNTLDRRTYLKEGYFFTCNCSRCSDPTEFGTYFSGVKCPTNRCLGYLLPEPNDILSYQCNKCHLIKDRHYLAQVEERVLTEYAELKFNPSIKNFNKIKYFIESHQRKVVHPGHEIILDVKNKLIQMMGKMPYLTPDFILEQINLTESILKTMEYICPGLSFSRGSMLECLFDSKIQLLLTTTFKIIGDSGGNAQFSKMIYEMKRSKQCANIIQDKSTFVRELMKTGEEALEIHILDPLNESKVARIRVNLNWLAETLKILAKYRKIEYPKHFSVQAIKTISAIVDGTQKDEYEQPVVQVDSSADDFIDQQEESRQSSPTPTQLNAQPSLIEEFRKINKCEFLVAAVIISVVIYEIKSYMCFLFGA